MFSRLFPATIVLLGALAVLVAAEPVPTPPPALPIKRGLEERDIWGDITQGAASVFSEAASGISQGANDVFTYVTSVGGQGVTLISEAGGSVYTLAANGVGQVTTIAGHEYTVATDGFQQFTSDVGSAYSSVTNSASPGAGFERAPISMTLVYSLGASLVAMFAGAAFVF